MQDRSAEARQDQERAGQMKRPQFLEWGWITLFSGVLIFVAGGIVAIGDQHDGRMLLLGGILIALGFQLLMRR